LEGRRDESVTLYADALTRWAAAGLPLDRALTAIDMLVVLGPDEPAARTAADDARELFSRLGARSLIEILDRAMAGSAAASSRVNGTGAHQPEVEVAEVGGSLSD